MEKGARPSFNPIRVSRYLVILCFLFYSFFFPATISGQTPGVQLAIPGDFVAPFDYLNEVPTNGLDINGDNQADIIPPCTCRTQAAIPNGTNANTGYFDDQVVIATGTSGQDWRVASVINAFHPDDLAAITEGTQIPEVGNTGVYVLPMAHQDALGYIIAVENTADYPAMQFGPLTNTCYYPDPLIENLGDTYCDTEPDVILLGSVTSDYDDNQIPFQPETEFWSITRLEDNANFITQNFSPSTLGGGHYRVRYSVNAGNTPNGNDNQTGCSVTVEQEVQVYSSHVMACNGGINITLNPNVCQVTLTPDILLANTPSDDAIFTIDVLAPGGGSLGNVIPAQYAGLSLLARIEDFCSGDFCFATVTVRDFAAPQLTVPEDVTIRCYETPDTALTGVATAEDCSPYTITYEDMVVDDECGNPISTVFRNWIVTDDFGNTTSDVQVISIARGGPSELYFPPDVEYSCGDFLANPDIVDPTEEGAGIPTLVEEEMCGLIYTSSDEVISLCGNPERSFIIIRTWVVLDLCGNTLYDTDANGNDNLQFIRVEDDTPPEVIVDPITAGATLAPQTTGLDGCSSVGSIPAPVVTDECNDYTIEIFTPLGEAEYFNDVDGADGASIPYPGLELGTHDITYVVTDACGNETELVVPLEVIDEMPPIMICDNFVNLVLSGDGMGRIMPSSIDEGSRDDCCTDVFKVKLAEEPDSLFRDFIDFDCMADTFSVVLRVWDCAGNFNQCTADVSVEDRIPPVLVQGVPDETVSCLEDYQPYLDPEFAAPVFSDNCGVTIDFMVEETVDDCGAGTLIRTWTASDNPLNSPVSFSQTVTLTKDIDYRVTFPADSVAACESISFPQWSVESAGCEMLATTVLLDTLFPPIDSICYQLLRVHQIINWCEYDGVADPLILPRSVSMGGNPQTGAGYQLRSDGEELFQLTGNGEVVIGQATGFYHYQQLINVIDTLPPQISVEEPGVFCTSDTLDNCSGNVLFQFSVSDNCSEELAVSYLFDDLSQPPFEDPFGTLVDMGDGVFAITGQYPVGGYAFQIMVTDLCGTLTQQSVPVVVEDCDLPILTCVDDAPVALQGDGIVTLSPADLLGNGTDNCGLAHVSFSMADAADTTRLYDCDGQGAQSLTVWASDVNGNQASCEASFVIQDEGSACMQFWDINGFVRTENDLPVGQTVVRLTGPVIISDTTGVDGKYSFSAVPEGQGYKISPGKNIDFDNGVTTFDLLLMTRHIIGVAPLDSPYKIIAADANRSGHVSTLDVIFFRKLVLNIDLVLANNTSWRFVPEQYEFPEPNNPFFEDFPEDIILESLSGDTVLNFVGIKIGDVNGTVNPANILEVEERNQPETLTFWAEDQILHSNEFIDVYVECPYDEVLGGQFGLKWDQPTLRLVEVQPESGIDANHFGYAIDEQTGQVRLSWLQLEKGERPVFKFSFEAKENGRLRDVLWLTEDQLAPEVYLQKEDGTLEVKTLALDFRVPAPSGDEFKLFQNRPNPFSDNTSIPFSLSEPTFIELKVFDVTGKVVAQFSGNYEAGLHQIQLDLHQLQGQGVFYYQLQGENQTNTKKMMLISD